MCAYRLTNVALVGQAGQQCTQSCVQSILCAHHRKGYLYHMVEKSLLGNHAPFPDEYIGSYTTCCMKSLSYCTEFETSL